MPRRSTEKEQFWRLVVEEHEASGLTAREFCRREQVSEPSFYSWRRKIRERDLPLNSDANRNAAKHGLVPVTVVDSGAESIGLDSEEAAATNDRIEIVATQPSGDILVRLDTSCATDVIHRVLSAIRRVNESSQAC